MKDNTIASKTAPKRLSLAVQIRRFGLVGFWIQLALLLVPLVLVIQVLWSRRFESAGPVGIDLGNYLSYSSLLLLAFTTFWFFRYIRLGPRVADPATSPPLASVERTLWVGVWASFIGTLFSVVLVVGSVRRMLFVLLATPQTGIQIAPALGDNPTVSLSAIDAASLAILLIIVIAELVVLGLSLWLLFRTTRLAILEAKAAPGEAPEETA